MIFLYKTNNKGGDNVRDVKKTFLEDQVSPAIDCNSLLQELKTNRKLVEIGNKADDSGSDTDLSDEDIPTKELNKILPIKPQEKGKRKKSKEKLKKRGGSLAPIKKDEDKEKKEAGSLTKVDGQLQGKHAKQGSFPLKAKQYKKVRLVPRDSLSKEQGLSIENGKEAQRVVEMVSREVQTDETGPWEYDEQEEHSLDKKAKLNFYKIFRRSKSPQAEIVTF